jgi:hypothetical protein
MAMSLSAWKIGVSPHPNGLEATEPLYPGSEMDPTHDMLWGLDQERSGSFQCLWRMPMGFPHPTLSVCSVFSVFRLNGIILGEAPKKQNRPKRNLDSLRLDGVDARPSSHPLVSQIMLTSTSCWAHRPRREDERRCWSPGFLKNNALTGTATYSV